MQRPVITLTAYFFLFCLVHCLSIEEKLTHKKTFPQKKQPEDIRVVLSAPEEDTLYLGELRVVYNEGYKKEYIIHRLQKRAAELGADILYIKNRTKFDSGWLVDSQQTGNAYSTQNKKIKIIADIYRIQ